MCRCADADESTSAADIAQAGGWALRHRRMQLLATLDPAARALSDADAALRRWRARSAVLEADMAAAVAAALPNALPRLQVSLPRLGALLF